MISNIHNLIRSRYSSIKMLYLLLPLCCCRMLLYAADDKEPEPEPILFETSVFLVVQGIGGQEMPAMINGDTAYLSVTDVFDFIKVRNDRSATGDSISGYFLGEKDLYLIDRAKNEIRYRDHVYRLHKEDLAISGTSIFLRLEYFGKVFGLPCKFNFRNLSVNMNTRLELPAIREMRLAQMRQNINRLQGKMKADTVIKRDYPLFRFGMADWSVVANQRTQASDVWVNLGLGATIAGGEATASLNYNNYVQQQVTPDKGVKEIRPFDQRQQYYRWRYVDNDQRGLRQIIAGKIFTQSTASIFDPVVGVQLTNAPTTYRRSFGTYTLSNITEPGWTVELYVNNALVDYTVADAAGFYTFDVPLVYGNSQIRLRFYGPFGEERIQEQNISVPFNFLPKNEFEYTASAGFVEDSLNSLFSRAQMNYGATRHITIGAGAEYLSSIPSDKAMPFVTTSIRMATNLLFNGEYTHNVRTQGILTYRTRSNLQVDLQYTRYKKGQQAIIYNFREERKIMLAKPFFGQHFSMFTRLTLNQFVSQDLKYTTSELLLSGAILRVGTNLTTYAVLVGKDQPFIYSNLGLSFRVPGNFLVMPQVQYAYTDNRLISARCEIGKYLFRNGYLNTSYERNYRSRISNFQVGLRYDFSFGQLGASILRGNHTTTVVESARGSLVYDGKTGYTGVSNRSMVGTGGVILQAFLDLNGNGQRDKGEPKAQGLSLSVNGGRVFQNRQDTTLRIQDMEPYTTYYLDLSRSSFDNIAWRAKNPVISVVIVPNQLKLIEVPVVVVGEVSGQVLLHESETSRGLGRIRVCFYRPDSSMAASTLTETDGFFNYMGLPPGSYTARIDPEQLKKLGLHSTPPSLPFRIAANKEGDVIDGLRFIVEREAGAIGKAW